MGQAGGRSGYVDVDTKNHTITNRTGLAKAQYALGYFTEMGIGCRRDPLEANVWYVKAADQGEARARHRIAIIRAAAEGNPSYGAGAKGKGKKEKANFPAADGEKGKAKRFGIF